MKIAIYGSVFHSSFNQYVTGLFDILYKKNISITIDKKFYNYLKDEVNIKPDVDEFYTGYKDLCDDVDFMVCIGGDGTFLETVSIVRDKGIPILGINSGRLGFLTYVAKEDIPKAIDDLIAGKYSLENRSLIELKSSNNMFPDFNYALNEVTIHKSDSSSMVKIHAYLNGEYLNCYWADGLIVSTPTGSTAYSLSVGGPIVVPDSENFIISPIAPHNLTVRPIVLPDDITLTFRVEGRSINFLASLDSKSEIFDSSVELTVKKANFFIKLVNFDDHNFFSTLRSKLMWGMDKRN